MNKWHALSQAFESLGKDFAIACENMGVTVEIDDQFDELYIVYVSLLEIMKMARQIIADRFDEIDSAE